MPVQGARYRVTTTDTGKKVRLAFKGPSVVEAKNLKTGATHTPAEFAADRKKAPARFPGIAAKGDSTAARARRIAAFEQRHGGAELP